MYVFIEGVLPMVAVTDAEMGRIHNQLPGLTGCGISHSYRSWKRPITGQWAKAGVLEYRLHRRIFGTQQLKPQAAAWHGIEYLRDWLFRVSAKEEWQRDLLCAYSISFGRNPLYLSTPCQNRRTGPAFHNSSCQNTIAITNTFRSSDLT